MRWVRGFFLFCRQPRVLFNLFALIAALFTTITEEPKQLAIAIVLGNLIILAVQSRVARRMWRRANVELEHIRRRDK